LNKFIKLASDTGQYWVINGNPVDVSSNPDGHKGYVVEYILRNHKVPNPEQYLDNIYYGLDKENESHREQVKILKKKRVSSEEIEVVFGDIDQEEYAIYDLGWIRITDSHIQFSSLTPDKLQQTASALLQIYGDRVRKFKQFYVWAGGSSYDNIPFEALEYGDVRAVKNSAYKYSQINRKFIKLAIQYDDNEQYKKSDKIDELLFFIGRKIIGNNYVV
jgi:hypothetical protein